MADKTLSVVEETPRASAIIHAPPKGKLAFSGDGPDRLLCGGCTVVLAEGVSDGQLFGVFIECPECGALNDVNPWRRALRRPGERCPTPSTGATSCSGRPGSAPPLGS